jgi:Mor family transcriptional regulator
MDRFMCRRATLLAILKPVVVPVQAIPPTPEPQPTPQHSEGVDNINRHHQPRTRLTEAQVSEVISLHSQGWSRARLATKFEVSQGMIYGIIKGRQGGQSPKVNPDQVREIRALHSQGMGQRALARKFSLSQGCIYGIIHRLSFKEIQ